jgi:hypothetical protein
VGLSRRTSASRAACLLVVIFVYVAGTAAGCHNAGVPATVRVQALERESPAASAGPSADVIAVIGWAAGGGIGRFDAITTAIAEFQDNRADPRSASLRTSCVQLEEAVSYGRAYAPIPIADAQRHWALALRELSASSVDCKAGIGRGDSSAIVKSRSGLEAGSAALMAARNAVLAVSPAN